MSRLYDVRIDQRRWKAIEVAGKSYHSYRVIDNDNNDMYFLSCIIGMEQVADNEFLVYRRYDTDHFQILRCVFTSRNERVIFSKTFSKFEFLDDDKILFQDYNNRGSYYYGGIYSIKENKLLEETEWLKYTPVEVEKDEDGNIFLYVEKELDSSVLDPKSVLFTVDPKTLKPTGTCYSELRDEYIAVNSKEDIDKIVKADEKKNEAKRKKLFEEKHEKLKAAKKMVLSRN